MSSTVWLRSCWSHSTWSFQEEQCDLSHQMQQVTLGLGNLAAYPSCIKADSVHWLLRYACWAWVRRLFISIYFQMWSSLATFSKANGAMKCLHISIWWETFLVAKKTQTDTSQVVKCMELQIIPYRIMIQELKSKFTFIVNRRGLLHSTRHKTVMVWGTLQPVLRCLSNRNDEWMTMRKCETSRGTMRGCTFKISLNILEGGGTNLTNYESMLSISIHSLSPMT